METQLRKNYRRQFLTATSKNRFRPLKKPKTKPKKLQKIIQFLKNLDHIKLDEKQQKALINPDLKQLITLEQPKQTP